MIEDHVEDLCVRGCLAILHCLPQPFMIRV